MWLAYSNKMSIFSPEQLATLKEYFKRYDTNGDGTISGKELVPLMEDLSLKTSAHKVRAFLRSVDTNNSGSIDFEEFAALISKKLLAPIKSMFEGFDKDGDGFITADELCQGLKEFNENTTEAELAKFVAAADKDGDGRVSYEEFAKMMNKLNIF